MKVCLQNTLLLLELILRYGGPPFTLVAAILGSGAVTWEVRRDHALNKTDFKIDELKKDIADIETDIQGFRGEMQAIRSMIIVTSFCTMRAIDGDKKPLQEWVGRIERCRKTGGEDSVKKE
ncbi:uncharacterized protein H6S33_000255 [Morchella sextelata]|uniref:uncharacterized protein n=1 Tax=Morchella sextelata TaxID=1174677 RepID=UPI001D0408CE|nr:uncharacterized protein H6S33_000255 [Morchella sextelata]KAH0614619.1 hypothetical protein H6S33_000255 [Morchella sextelata]